MTALAPLPQSGSFTETITLIDMPLLAVWNDRRLMMPARPLCEALGIDWRSQQIVIQSPDKAFSWGVTPSTGADGKTYQMLCLTIADTTRWLLGIQLARVKPERRALLLRMQIELPERLFEYATARLIQERDAMADSLRRLTAEVMRRPIYNNVQRLAQAGYGFEAIRRSTSYTKHRLVTAIGDMMRLGVLDAAPAGTPFDQPQLGGQSGAQLTLFAQEA